MALEQIINENNKVKTKNKGFLKALLLTTAILSFPSDIKPETYKPQAPKAESYETILNENGIHNNNDLFSYNLEQITTPKWMLEGRIARAKRFEKTFEKYEKMYDMPEGLLAGLAMQESYAEPLALNSTNDGGAGIMQFQPGTARWLGLEVYGSSNRTGRDFRHGKELRDLLEEHNYNLDVLADIDERFDPEKAIEASAEYLKRHYDRFGSWEKALSTYRRGSPSENPMKTIDVTNIYSFKKAYNLDIGEQIASN